MPMREGEDSGLILAYWDIRGLCDFLRLMLYYKNVNFTNKTYSAAYPYQWEKEKFNLGMNFPNVPYLVDKKNNTIISESYAIGKYLTKKYGIGSSTYNSDEHQIEGVVHDILIKFFMLCYNPDFEKERSGYLQSLVDKQDKLYQIDKYLAKRVYLVNNYELSFVDFKFFSFLDYNFRLDKTCLDKLQNVKRYYKAIDGMDFVKRFQNDGLRNLAIVKPDGIFGGKPILSKL